MENNKGAGNSPTGESAGPPDYQASIRDDEIDLVDLWLLFWSRRKVFLSTAILLVVIGIAGLEMLTVSKKVVTVRSIIEVQVLLLGETNVTIRYVEALSKRIKQADLPRVASFEEFKPIKSHLMSSSINPIEGTSLIELVTIAPASLSAEVSRFHFQMTEHIVSELESSSRELNASLRKRFNELKGGVALMQGKMEGLAVALGRNAVAQTSSNQPGQIEINIKMADLSSQIFETAKNLDSLGLILRDINPRVLEVASLSERTVAVNKSTAYSLIIILAVFAGIFVILVESFASRVRDRVAGRS